MNKHPNTNRSRIYLESDRPYRCAKKVEEIQPHSTQTLVQCLFPLSPCQIIQLAHSLLGGTLPGVVNVHAVVLHHKVLAALPVIRGLYSSTFRLDVSTLWRTRWAISLT
jgi:hypothetical protein